MGTSAEKKKKNENGAKLSRQSLSNAGGACNPLTGERRQLFKWRRAGWNRRRGNSDSNSHRRRRHTARLSPPNGFDQADGKMYPESSPKRWPGEQVTEIASVLPITIGEKNSSDIQTNLNAPFTALLFHRMFYYVFFWRNLFFFPSGLCSASWLAKGL